MDQTIPKSPGKLAKSGRRFWKQTHEAFVLDDSQGELLYRACTMLDRADQAASVLDKEGLLTTNRFGSVVPHPLVSVEASSIGLFRHLVKQLRIAEEHE